MPKIKWTINKVKLIAKKYTYKKDFIKNSGGAYRATLRNNWIDDVCSHMIPLGNKYFRCIYTYVFSDKSVYVGLTYNPKKRNKYHLTNSESIVFQHSKKHKLNPIFKIESKYVNILKASILEKQFVKKYKSIGYNVLNRKLAGGLGGNTVKWTKESVHNEALEYNTRISFLRGSNGAYNAAKRNGWLNDVCSHINNKKPKGYWTNIYNCHTEALKYNRRIDFHRNNNSAYESARKRNWLNIICTHMVLNKND